MHCSASQEVPRGLISSIRVDVLIVCLLCFLTEGVENLIVHLWKGFECRWSNSASLCEEREGSPVHPLCLNRLPVGVEGDDFIRGKFVDVPRSQKMNGMLGERLACFFSASECLGVVTYQWLDFMHGRPHVASTRPSYSSS